MDTKSASIRGPIAKQENAEKKKTMNDPGTPRLPRSRTDVYKRQSYKSQEYFEVQSIKFIAAEDNREHAFVQTTKLQPVVAIFNDLQSVV